MTECQDSRYMKVTLFPPRSCFSAPEGTVQAYTENRVSFDMAKRKPTLTLSDMEKELGYGTLALASPTEPFTRLYSDLNPVSDSAYERMRREYEEYQRTKNSKCDAHSATNELQGLAHNLVKISICVVTLMPLTWIRRP